MVRPCNFWWSCLALSRTPVRMKILADSINSVQFSSVQFSSRIIAPGRNPGLGWSQIRTNRGGVWAWCSICAMRWLINATEYLSPQQTITHCQLGDKAGGLLGIPGRSAVERVIKTAYFCSKSLMLCTSSAFKTPAAWRSLSCPSSTS